MTTRLPILSPMVRTIDSPSPQPSRQNIWRKQGPIVWHAERAIR
jgi:hypothetical protein